MVENTVKQELEVATSEIDRYIGLARTSACIQNRPGKNTELRANAKLTLGETDSTFANPPPVAQGRRSAIQTSSKPR